MKKIALLAALLIGSFTLKAQTSTIPANLGEYEVFKAAKVPIAIAMPPAFTIDTVIVEIWEKGKKLSDSTVVTISGDTVKFTLSVKQIKPLAGKESYFYVRFDGDSTVAPQIGAKLIPRIGVGIPRNPTRVINLPSIGVIRVSMVGDAGAAIAAANSAIVQANVAKAYRDSTEVLLDSAQTTITELQDGINAVVPTTDMRIVYEKRTWPNLTEFVNQSSSAAIASGSLQFVSGAGNFLKTLEIPEISNTDAWKIETDVVIGNLIPTSYGWAIGKRSTGGYGQGGIALKFGQNSGVGQGKIVLFTGTTYNQITASTDSVDFAVADQIRLTLERDGMLITASAINLTNPNRTATISKLYSAAQGSTFQVENIGRFAIFNIGGSFFVNSLVVTTKVPRYANLAVVGDSKTQGYFTTTQANRYGDILNKVYKPTITLGSGSDRTKEVSSRLPELFALHPKKVLLAIGSNDVRQGLESSAVIYARYDSITNAIEAQGISVYHLPMWETSISLAGLRTHIITTFPTGRVIDAYTAMQTAGSSILASDGVHPNNAGFALIASTVISSGKLPDDNALYTTRTKRISGTAYKSGTGSATDFKITHGLGAVPNSYTVSPASSVANSPFYLTADKDYIIIHHTSAPASGVNNLVYTFTAEL